MNPEPSDAANVKSLRRTRQSNLAEIVERLANIHTRLSDQYNRLSDQASAERVQLVLRYLAGQEAALAVYLHQFLEQAPETVLHRRFKYVPDLDGNELFAALEGREPATPEDIVELIHEVHKAIDTVYAPLTENMLPEELAETVEKLRLQEREHVIQQLRAAMDE